MAPAVPTATIALTLTVAPTPAPSLLPTIAPTIAPTASPTSKPVTVPIGYKLGDSQLAKLGSPTGTQVPSRQVVLERFQNGVMVVFAASDKGFVPGGEFIFALAKDGHAWRVADTFVEKSKFPDDWYTCDRKPGLRPERSGVPWRGFGKAWCEHPEVRAALGIAKSYEESEITASLQSFERGRVFQVSDWRGIPGWTTDHVYAVYLDTTDPSFASGHWE